MKMTDRPSHNLDGLDIKLARRIDEVCRRFEADWRQGRRPRIDDYMGEVPDEGQPVLRAELQALADETVVRPEAGAPTEPEPMAPPNQSTIAEAATIVPGTPPTSPLPGAVTS